MWTAEQGWAASPSLEDLSQLSIEELANIQITSVSKRPEPLSRAPASVFVITSDDIRRSGANSLPEVLRLAPNLQVARLNAQSYAISARGFNTYEAATKLLVLMDGRSVYTPLHAGVFWDQQQMMLEDIERIEVISGPGGTLWGANAVNGVINIITRHSQDTQGGIASLNTGNVDHNGRARYGGRINDNATYRAYGIGNAFGDTVTTAGNSGGDDWKNRQAGFRSDWSADGDAVTLQGDLFNNRIETGHISGGNLLVRWTRELSSSSEMEVQAYYDRVERIVPGVIDRLETFDVEAQHTLRLGSSHQVVWGGGYRVSREEFDNTLNQFVLRPIEDTQLLGNIFVQDSIALADDLTLTIGNKFEHSNYSGLEYLPSARLAWQVSENALIWSAVSRAVRSPSRFDRDLQAPGLLDPAKDDFEVETLIAYEIGIRGQPTAQTTASLSLFYHDYDDLRILAVNPAGRLTFSNRMHGYSYGMELWGDHKIMPWWRISAGLTTLTKELELEPGALPAALDQHQGNDPSYQASLRSAMDLTDEIEFDVGLRVVDELKQPAVPSYVALDARVGWQVSDALTLSLSGFNLLDDRHPETLSTSIPSREIPRTVYAGATWRF